jgi:hypothetical protein
MGTSIDSVSTEALGFAPLLNSSEATTTTRPTQSSSPTRIPTRLAPKPDKRLLTYPAKARAAGVGLLAPRFAETEIVYTAAKVKIIANQAATNRISIVTESPISFRNSGVRGLKRKVRKMA